MWLHLGHGLGHVAGVQPAGEKQRQIHLVANAPADAPVVHAAGASEFLDRELLVSGIE